MQLIKCNSARNTPRHAKECRRCISLTTLNDIVTSYFIKTNIYRCSCCTRLCNINFRWRFFRIPFTKIDNIDICNFTIKNGCNCFCTCTTNSYTIGIFTIINDIDRRCIGISFTTREHFNISNRSRCNRYIKDLCAYRLNDSGSRRSGISSTPISDQDFVYLTILIDSGYCCSIDTTFRCRININQRRIGITSTKRSYLNAISNQSAFRIDFRLSASSTIWISESNCRNKIVSTTRILNRD